MDGVGASELREATWVEWLVNCPDRCERCRRNRRDQLERVRRILEAKAKEQLQLHPEVNWKRLENSGRSTQVRVEVTDGTHRAELKGHLAEMFLAIAERMPQSLDWRSYIQARLGQDATRRNQKPINRETPTNVGLSETSAARKSRAVRTALGPVFGNFWHSDRHGAAWQPPEGSSASK